MERRTIVGTIGSVLAAGGIGMMGTWASTTGPGMALLWAGFFTFALGISMLLWLWWTASAEGASKGTTMARDTFVNNGTNSGHIGPVNYDKPEFSLTSEDVTKIIASCPKGSRVIVRAVGPQRAFPMQAAVMSALRAAGYEVTDDSAAMTVPAPEHPLAVYQSAPGEMTVVIAPNA